MNFQKYQFVKYRNNYLQTKLHLLRSIEVAYVLFAVLGLVMIRKVKVLNGILKIIKVI